MTNWRLCLKLFYKEKTAWHLTSQRLALWVVFIFFPLIAACTSLNEQLADSASLAQTAKTEQEEETPDKKNGGKLIDGAPASSPQNSNDETSSTNSTISSQTENLNSVASVNASGKSDKPKSLLSMFSGKHNNGGTTIEASVDVANEKPLNDSHQAQTVGNAVDNSVSENINNGQASQPKSLFSLFSNKKDTSSEEKKAVIAANQTIDETVENNTVTNKDIMTARAQSQDQGARMRLFSGSGDDSVADSKGNANRLAALKPEKVDRSQYSVELPGVRPNGGIEIKHRTSLYDDTDIDANEVEAFPSIQLASVGGLGRSLPNGLRLAHKAVDARCLKPGLINLLKTVERKFNRPVYITSGYRSPIYNRKVNGANRSLHMSCAAADIIIPGVHKYEVAKFVRSLPGRGGVGTYCHQAIHVDIGPRRDWNWSCSGKK